MDPTANMGAMRGLDISAFSLTAAMKERTADLHRQVERRPFFQNIVQENITKQCYVQYLANLKCIYGALESGLRENISNQSVGPLCISAIFREQQLAADLAALGGADIAPSMRAQEHAAHLKHLSDFAPTLLIAHAYTRFLGDLFGGQYIGQAIAKMWGDECCSIYGYQDLLEEFSLEKPAQFALAFRNILNDVKLTDEQASQVVAEALVALQYADNMIKELV